MMLVDDDEGRHSPESQREHQSEAYHSQNKLNYHHDQFQDIGLEEFTLVPEFI